MSTLTIRTPGDIPAVVASTLGFHPEDSLVIIGIGGPTARVDLGPVDETLDAFAPAVPHWQTIVMVVYTDNHDTLTDLATAWWTRFPDVQIAVAARVHDGMVYTNADDPGTPAKTPDGPRRVVKDRATLESEAAEVDSPDVAWTIAEGAYDAGNGAMAWCFLDRYVALIGGQSDARADALAVKLYAAVPPAAMTGANR